jgi:hypothetical protein
MTPVQRRIIFALLLMAGLVAVCGLLWWLWGVLAAYIQPTTPTDKKDLVNVFVLIAAGVIGALTAIAALGNLYISRRNLQQQRDLDERRSQDAALQSYYEQMGKLLAEQGLMKTENKDDPLRLLARAHTLTVLGRLDGKRKKDVLLFVYGAGLIDRYEGILDLYNANLSGSDLSGAYLVQSGLEGVDLSRADLRDAWLPGSNLSWANLTGAQLDNADFAGTDLDNAVVTKEQLDACETVSSATLPGGVHVPEGQDHVPEDWP